MATIINNPGGGDTGNGNANGGGSGLIIGIVIAIVVLALVFFYVLPNMNGGANNAQPSTTGGGTETPSTMNVDVPDEIDVNVKQ